MVSIHRYSSVSFHHIFRLHKNFLHPSSKPNSWPHFPKATKPSNSTEHSSIQKGGVQCTVGAGSMAMVLALTPQRGFSTSTYLTMQFTITLVFLNSSLNPLLYCWKIREVRQAVKEILRGLRCSSN